MGVLAHRVIADLMSHPGRLASDTDAWREVLDVVDERMALDGYCDRAARQTVTAAALGYLRSAPSAPWHFLAAELPLPGARLDLVWWNPISRTLLIDEVKTGQTSAASPATAAQAARYRDVLLAQGVPTQALIVRVVSTSPPHSTWTLPPVASTGMYTVAGRAPPH